jgi:hypothetical protein
MSAFLYGKEESGMICRYSPFFLICVTVVLILPLCAMRH